MVILDVLGSDGPGAGVDTAVAELAVAAVESSRDIVALYDRDRRMVLVSDVLCELVGLARHEVIGRRTAELINDSRYMRRTRDTFEILDEMVGLVVDTGISHIDDDSSRLTPAGDVQPASIRILPIRRGDEVVGALFRARDLELAGSMMFRRAAVGMAHVERRGGVREVNDALLGLVGQERGDVQGRPFVDLLHPDDVDEGRTLLEDVLYGIVADRRAELRLGRPGSERWVLLSAASNQLGGSGRGGACVVVQDITERVALEKDLEHAHRRLEAMALHDDLTGLPNRAFLTSQMEATQREAAASGAHTAVLFVDLDDFKAVNDTAGHERGDRLLRCCADRIRSVLRPGDFAARLGGDEFVVCAAGLDADPAAARASAEAIAGRIVDAVAQPFVMGPSTWRIGASVGLALSRAGSLAPDEMLRRADADMYDVKATRGGARQRPSPAGW